MPEQMKRIRFTGVIEMLAADFGDFRDAEHVVDVALTYGDNHQAFGASREKVVSIEDWENA